MNDALMSASAVDAIRDLAAAATDIRDLGARPVIALPDHFKVHCLESFLPHPTRPRGVVTLRTTESFIDFVRAHQCAGTSLYMDDGDKPSFLAVFNDHLKDLPGWRDFRASYSLPLAREWVTWTSSHGRAMAQDTFAAFIEDNLPDVVDPPGADMLTISRTLEAKKSLEFKSAVRLADGAQELTFVEDIMGTAGKGAIKIPETFSLGIPVFNGGQAYRVTARLRYRIANGKLSLWYELLRAHKVLEDALQSARERIETEVAMRAFVGSI